MPFCRRPPDEIIGPPDDPYMRRWHLIPRNRWLNIYLHNVVRSDDARALHDHPWASLSIILRGGYCDITPDGARHYRRGSIIARSARHSHRLEVFAGGAWTLFITGRRVRDWGFDCPEGWIPWQWHEERGGCGERK